MLRKLTLAALAVALATPAFAEVGIDKGPAPRNEPRKAATAGKLSSAAAATRSLKAAGAASATYARVALVFDFQDGVLLSKGVSSVRNPSAGLYCIKPSVSISTATAVPVVSPDYYLSSGAALSAMVYSGTKCLASEFGVQTLRGDSGSFLRSDYVGFDFIVP